MFSGADPILRIDGDAVVANLALVRGVLGDHPFLAVLKDNAYGHGMLPIGRLLAAHGVGDFAVGSVEEACALQAGGIPGRILSMRLFARSEARRIVARGIAQAAFTDEHVDALAAAAREIGRRAVVHVKVDTGLGRFGVPVGAAREFIRRASRREEITLAGVFSMLAEHSDRDDEQIRRFAALRREVGETPGTTWHLVASHGVLGRPDAWFDAVRVGCLLCGFPPSREPVEDLRPTVRLEAPVLGVRALAAGERVGFRSGWNVAAPTRAAWVGIGLRHGLRESVADGGEVLINGRAHPIRQVAGEFTLVEIADGSTVETGATAVLLGRQGRASIGLDEFARRMNAGAYTALTALGPRVRRELDGDRAPSPTYDPDS